MSGDFLLVVSSDQVLVCAKHPQCVGWGGEGWGRFRDTVSHDCCEGWGM